MESNSNSLLDSFSRSLVLNKMKSLRYGHLSFSDNDQEQSFGDEGSFLKAKIIIHDRKFYSELIFGGSLGAAEAFMMGYWECDDLTTIVRILLMNRSVLDGFDSGFGSFFKQKTAYEISLGLVGSEMCIRDSLQDAHKMGIFLAIILALESEFQK